MLDARVVIVNHRSGDRLGHLLKALDGRVREIVVVDNASFDGSADIVERAMGRDPDSLRLIRSATNDGFSVAANDGAREAATDWLVFANPDVHPAEGDLERLLAGEPAPILAPVQTDADGTPRPESGGWDPSPARLMVWAALPTSWHGRRGPWLSPPPAGGDQPVDWVSGALLAVRTDLFQRLGGFDERFFLYLEDVDLCRRARSQGAAVLLRGEVRVFHEIADGDPERRAAAAARWVTALGIDAPRNRRRLLGVILALGFGLRSLAGRPGARQALGRSVNLVFSRW